MKYILSASQSKRADMRASGNGIPSMVLMERAALSVVSVMAHRKLTGGRILVAAGTGNNGGDGIAVARILYERGLRPEILLLGKKEKYSEQMRQQMRIISLYQPVFVDRYEAGRYDLVIDAVFGIGLHRDIQGSFYDVIDAINRDGARVIAIDVPSGINTDSGAVCGIAIKADITVTFSSGKPGLFLYPGAFYAGEVLVREIGIPIRETAGEEPALFFLEKSDIERIPLRDASGNKGTFGKLLVAAGSPGIFGAAYLAARSALMTGIGMVKVLTAENNRVPMNVVLPEALLSTWSEGEDPGERITSELDWADGVLAGPGIGTSAAAEAMLYSLISSCRQPLTLDADALNIMSRHEDWWKRITVPCVITPHVGEMSRLTGQSVQDIKKDPIGTARKFASEHGVTCVLKDARSVIARPDGTCWINLSGCSAMATAGSGDVLSGIMAGMLTQYGNDGELPTEALADYIHGLCGEKAAGQYSDASVTARNIMECIPAYL